MDPETGKQDLIQRAQSGDRAAREALYAEHHDALDHYVRLRVGPHLRAEVPIEDVIQETFARVFASLDRFQWRNEQSFARWLKGIAEHVILHFAQDQRRDRIIYVQQDDPPASTASPSRVLRREERFARLQEALDALSPDHRQVIVLARLKGLSIKTIAERMNRSPNAVAIGDEMEMSFRFLYTADGIHNYFWKARPRR